MINKPKAYCSESTAMSFIPSWAYKPKQLNISVEKQINIKTGRLKFFGKGDQYLIFYAHVHVCSPGYTDEE